MLVGVAFKRIDCACADELVFAEWNDWQGICCDKQ